MFPDNNSWNRIVTEPSSPRTHPTRRISSLVSVVSTNIMSLTLVSTTAATEDTVCVLTSTLVVARWMSARAWTSRSTTSVWPFLLAAYTGLTPSCIGVKNDMGGGGGGGGGWEILMVQMCPAITQSHTHLSEEFFPQPVAM